MRSPLVPLFYWANVNTWIRPLIRLNVSREVAGLENLPRRGPVILASNHCSEADPAILMVSLPRRIVWMAKRELFQIPFFGLAYHLYGCIPVRRFEADLGALHESRNALQEGELVGMFPEGTRSRGDSLGSAAPGTALLALRTGVSVLPVAISGSESIALPGSFLKRTPVKVTIGEPFRAQRPKRIRSADVRELSEVIMGKIASLLPLERRGRYGSEPAIGV